MSNVHFASSDSSFRSVFEACNMGQYLSLGLSLNSEHIVLLPIPISEEATPVYAHSATLHGIDNLAISRRRVVTIVRIVCVFPEPAVPRRSSRSGGTPAGFLNQLIAICAAICCVGSRFSIAYFFISPSAGRWVLRHVAPHFLTRPPLPVSFNAAKFLNFSFA